MVKKYQIIICLLTNQHIYRINKLCIRHFFLFILQEKKFKLFKTLIINKKIFKDLILYFYQRENRSFLVIVFKYTLLTRLILIISLLKICYSNICLKKNMQLFYNFLKNLIWILLTNKILIYKNYLCNISSVLTMTEKQGGQKILNLS